MTEIFSGDVFKDRDGNDVFAGADHFVKAGNEYLLLCAMCVKSRMTCDNLHIREIEVPLEVGDNSSLEIRYKKRLEDGTYEEFGRRTKFIDGVKAGIIKSEDEIPIPVICMWFEQKELG